jgi:hypothetical protein
MKLLFYGLNFFIRRANISSLSTLAPEKAHGYSFSDFVFQAIHSYEYKLFYTSAVKVF